MYCTYIYICTIESNKNAQSTLQALTLLSKQERLINIVLSTSQFDFPTQLQSTLHYPLHYLSTTLAVGEMAPNLMTELLKQWKVRPHLALALQQCCGGHVLHTSKALSTLVRMRSKYKSIYSFPEVHSVWLYCNWVTYHCRIVIVVVKWINTYDYWSINIILYVLYITLIYFTIREWCQISMHLLQLVSQRIHQITNTPPIQPLHFSLCLPHKASLQCMLTTPSLAWLLSTISRDMYRTLQRQPGSMSIFEGQPTWGVWCRLFRACVYYWRGSFVVCSNSLTVLTVWICTALKNYFILLQHN
jgi:hypothetical protein